MADTRQADRLAKHVEALLPPKQSDAASPAGPVDESGETDRLTEKSQWSNWTVLAMIVLCFFVIVRFRPFARNHTVEGRTLSQLRLQPLTGQGQPVTLADLTGRVVLINFWEARSSLSREALPYMAAIEKQFRSRRGFRLLAVSCDRRAKEDFRELRAHTRTALRQKNVDLPTYGDPGGISRSAVDEAVGLSGYPTTLILDRWGRIRKAWTGFQPGVETEMQKLVTQLLEEG